MHMETDSSEISSLIQRLVAGIQRYPPQRTLGVIKLVIDQSHMWVIDSTTTPVQVHQVDIKCDCTVRVSLQTLLAIANGTLQTGYAFMLGQVKIEGNFAAALMLDRWLGGE
jgi:putative sterol carrier protein